MSTNPLQRLEPSDKPLPTLIFDRVDDSMLLEIAKSDYGDDVDTHLTALKFRKTEWGVILIPAKLKTKP
jgi:hypothetical protein